MLTSQGLRKEFGQKVAVKDVTLTVGAGELFGFLGPNGAGKTTTIRMLAGLLAPTAGRVAIGEVDLQKDPQTAKRMIGYVPDRPLVYDKLTGREYLQFMMELYDVPQQEAESRAAHYLEQFELLEAQDELTGSYSLGMKQKISLIGQLIHDPRVLLLDEPTVGLDPKAARRLRDVLRELCDEGVAVLISTHLLPIAELMCDRVGIMDHGTIIADGTVAELRSRYHSDASLEDLFLQLTDGDGAKGDAEP